MSTLAQQVAALSREIEYLKGNHTSLVKTVETDYANVRDADVAWLVLCGEQITFSRPIRVNVPHRSCLRDGAYT